MRRRLDVELVRRGLAPTRSRAVDLIDAGRVLVGGSPARVASRRVEAAEAVVVEGPPPRFVSRGGEKLEAGLDRFGVEVTGRRGLDAGASTGGFTDCLLQRGAASVVAVDVGHAQLAWRLRTDPRVDVRERTNLRSLRPGDIGGPVDVAVADLSFISLVTVGPALARLSAPGADLVLLVKPQFEAGRARVGRGGVVRDPGVHRVVLEHVVDGLAAAGIVADAVVPSPLRGRDGNVEFVLHASRDRADRPAALGAAALDAAVGAAHAIGDRSGAGSAEVP